MNVKTNSVINLISSVLAGAVLLATIPLLLHKIGEERLGIVTIIWLLSGYMGLFDFGLSQATGRAIAKEKDPSAATVGAIFWTAFWLSTMIGLTVCTILIIFGPTLIGFLFRIDSAHYSEILSLRYWIALLVPLAMVSGVCVGTLEGRNRFATANAGQIFGTVVVQIFPTLTAYWLSPDLVQVVPAIVMARLMSTLLLFALSIGAVSGRLRFIDLAVARALFTFGSWVFLASILSTVFPATNNLIIAALLGPASVTHFAIPESVVRRVSLLPAAFVRALYYRFSSLDDGPAYELAIKAIEMLIFLITPVVVTVILFIRIFLDLWVGVEFASVAAPVATVIAVVYWFNSIAFLPDAYLRGRGLAHRSALSSVIEIIPHFALFYLGLAKLGLIGGALALLLITVFDLALLIRFSRLLILKKHSLWIGLVFVLVAYATTVLFPVLSSLVSFMIYLTQILAVSIWAVTSSPELKSTLKGDFLRTLSPRISTKR